MAIRIIKPGRKKIPIYSVKCSYCECEFEFERNDMRIDYDRDGELGQISCPNCYNLIMCSTKPKRYEII